MKHINTENCFRYIATGDAVQEQIKTVKTFKETATPGGKGRIDCATLCSLVSVSILMLLVLLDGRDRRFAIREISHYEFSTSADYP